MAHSKQWNPIGGYRAVWLIVMYDLPVKTKQDKRIHSRFRKKLLNLGFFRMQYSIYGQYFSSLDSTMAMEKRIVKQLPSKGCVRFLKVTDRQFGRMKSFSYSQEINAEKRPPQILML